jgi:glycosyltransferase involved in cell wall biosynthesis
MYRLDVPHVLIPNGVAFDQLRVRTNLADLRAATETAPNAVVVLFSGNLSRQKRPDRFLRVIQRSIKEVPNVSGWLLGDGPDRAALEEQARALRIERHVRFLGAQSEVAPYVAASDFYLSTSDTEGIPAVVLEAGFLGKPAIGTRVGGMPECVRDGDTGFLVPAGDESALVEHVVRLARDPAERTRLGERAREWVSEEFAMPRIGDQYLELFSSLLDGEARRTTHEVVGDPQRRMHAVTEHRGPQRASVTQGT